MLGNLIASTRDIATIIRQPRRISVSNAASEYVRIEAPGGYSGPWDPDITPYMCEPMDMLKSREHGAVVFVSPARTGKTQALLDGWLAHCVIADPGDMGLYFSTQNLAYDYRKRRLVRLHKYSEKLRDMLSKRAHDTTVEMIVYRSGMILNLGWPTSSQLAQRDLRYVAMSDYDSFPDDIDGEGSPFDLAKKRIQVAMSAGMALVESSPKRPITVANYQLSHPHEAPPVDGGILPLYNRGSMARWKWSCIDGCGERFEAPAMPEVHQDSSVAHVVCPECGTRYGPSRKRALNASGMWEHAREARTKSYWLLGCASAFQAWDEIFENYWSAKRHTETTNDEAPLTSTTNLDQGLPYRPRALESIEAAANISGREKDTTARFFVPRGVRALIATVDVQKWSFEVAVWGHGKDNARWLVDRYAIHLDEFGDKIRPGVDAECWKILKDRVVDSQYRIDGDTRMRVFATAVDMGGERGVSERAYAWWRWLKRAGRSGKVRLVKGGSAKGAPMVRESVPDATKRAARPTGGAGDVPVLMLNVDKLKDICQADLSVSEPGPNYVTFCDWTPARVFDELSSEQRTLKGWENVPGRRNETWDLMVYDRAIWAWVGGDKVNWSHPPAWLAEWEENTMVGARAVKKRSINQTKSRRSAPRGRPIR